MVKVNEKNEVKSENLESLEKVLEKDAKKPKKATVKKDRHGMTTVNYLSDAIRSLEKISFLDPDLYESKLKDLIPDLITERDSRKSIKVESDEEIEAKIAKLTAKLKKNRG